MTGFISFYPLRMACSAAALAGALLLGVPAAQAQGMVAQVNNRAITSLDVAQRVRIAAMIEHRRIGTKEALEELIDDQAKIIEANRVGYRVTEDGVEGEFAKIAKSNGQSTRQFEDVLRRAGLEPSAVRDKLRANIAWQALTRDRAKLGTNVTRAEVESAAAQRKTAEKTIEYTLIPIVFVVPPGSSPGARISAANAARSRFTDCDTGFDAMRALPDVVVRPSVVRNSNDLTKPLKALFEKTPVGRTTPAAAGESGVEIIAVCGKRDVSGASGGDLVAVADDLSEQKIKSTTKGYLAEIRKKVTIRYHR